MEGSRDHGRWGGRDGYGRGNRGYTGERSYGSGHRRGYGPNRGGRYDDFDDNGTRGGARGSFFDEDSYNRGFNNRRNDQRGKRGRGYGPPPHLRGKEIGLWYARRGKANAAAKEQRERKEVVMEGDQKREIQRLLSDIKSDRREKNTPETGDVSQSRKDWFDSEDVEKTSQVRGPVQGTSGPADRYNAGTSDSIDQSTESTDFDETEMEVDGSPVTESTDFDETEMEVNGLSLTDIVKEWSEDSMLDVTSVTDSKEY